MKKLKFFYLLLMIFFAASCAKDQLNETTGQLADETYSLKCASPKLKIAVVSDIHYMSPTLLPDNIANNPYFQAYLAQDPKLIELSDPIFRKVISELIIEKPDILLVPGDLTKDGEKVDHLAVSGFLHHLAAMHIKVLVIPGNHDINNPEAVTYKGASPTPVAQVTPDEFATIYGDFGYNDAIYKDDNSLSYISKLSDKLWILGIDACKYDNNITTSEVSGAIKPATMTWILNKLAIAQKRGITVLAMMHHGIMEHYVGENTLDPGYVIDDYPEHEIAFMEAGIRFVFTGHYHANDITEFNYGGKTLYDIETGSLVTPPSPYRIMTLDNNLLSITTRRVTSINAVIPGRMNFLTYSHVFLSGHLDAYFDYILVNYYGIPSVMALVAAPLLRDASMAHFAGDERISPAERIKINALSLSGAPAFLVNAINSFWTDLPPCDNIIQISLK